MIECDGHYMLIDGGPLTAQDKVYNTLLEKKVKHLDILAVSRIHDDYLGGLAKALTYASTVDLTLCSTEDSELKTFKNFQRELYVNKGEITFPETGKKYSLGSATVEILDAGEDSSESIILLIKYGKTTFLFTGDMERRMEERFCTKYDDNFHVSLLKVARHGSDTSTSIRFLKTVRPEYAVISVGKNNSSGHPGDNTLSRLEQAGVTCYRTDTDGDIHVSSDKKSISIKTSK